MTLLLLLHSVSTCLALWSTSAHLCAHSAMSILTSDEITKRCQDLVYQVAYAFYDSPYILCLKVLAQLEV